MFVKASIGLQIFIFAVVHESFIDMSYNMVQRLLKNDCEAVKSEFVECFYSDNDQLSVLIRMMASSDAVVPEASSTEYFGYDEVSHSIGYKEEEKTFKISRLYSTLVIVAQRVFIALCKYRIVEKSVR